jgi:hypothetical protein
VRLAGRAVIASVNVSSVNFAILIGWRSSQAGGSVNIKHAVWFAAGGGVNAWNDNLAVGLTFLTATDYPCAAVLRGTGCFLFIKISGNWKLAWINVSDTTTPLFPAIDASGTAGQTADIAYLRVRDLAAPFTTDLGIAQNNVTSFTQSAGAELLTNGNFSGWTADNPDGWAVSGEVGSDPMVTQVQPNGSAGTGAARLFASTATSAPQLRQNVLTVGQWYEVSINLTARTSGTAQLNELGGSAILISTATTGIHSTIGRPTATNIQVAAGGAAHDFTVDDASVKLLTLNAVATMAPNSIIDFFFTDPAAVAGRTVQLWFRVQDDQNYWTAYVKVNDAATNWDFNLDSVVAGVATNRLHVTNINGQDGIRIICDGNLIDCYTRNGSTWTKRGSQVNNSTLATATGLTTLYSTGTTPSQLINYKRSSSAYSVLDVA